MASSIEIDPLCIAKLSEVFHGHLGFELRFNCIILSFCITRTTDIHKVDFR